MSERSEITRAVVEAVVEILPTVEPAQVVGHRHLKELGADSVDRVEIILSVLGRLGLDEPLASFSDLPHVEAMVDFLHERSRR